MKWPKARQVAGGGMLVGIGALVGAMITSAPGDAAMQPVARAALPGTQAQAAEAATPVLAKADPAITTPEQAGYAIKSVIFESSTGLWSVTFDRNQAHRSPESCVVVFVHDQDKTAEVQSCA